MSENTVDDTEVMAALRKIERLMGTYVVQITPKDTSGARVSYHTRSRHSRNRLATRFRAEGIKYNLSGRARSTALAANRRRGKTRELGITFGEAPDRVDNVDLIVDYLPAGGRDFAAVTPLMEQQVIAALDTAVQALLDENLSPAGAKDAIGEAVQNIIADRLQGNNEVQMPPNKPSTVRRKGHGHLGVESGALRDGIVQSNVRTVKQ